MPSAEIQLPERMTALKVAAPTQKSLLSARHHSKLQNSLPRTHTERDTLGNFVWPKTIRSVYTDERHDIYVDNAPFPRAGPGECIVKIEASGICGSDCTLWRKGSIGGHCVGGPHRLGHESAGIVVAVGPSVDQEHIAIGDRVAVEPGIACGECKECRTGWYNLCQKVQFASVPPYHGMLAEYISHPASWLHKLSDTTDLRTGALIEPMSIALASVRRGDLRLGQPVCIIGAGSIGLMIYLLARASGATPITLVDTAQARLDFAVHQLGLDPACAVLSDPSEPPAQVASHIVSAMRDQRPSIIFECTGFQSPILTAIHALELGGCLTQVGIGPDVDAMPFSDMLHRQIDLRFVMRANSCFQDCIRLVEDRIVDPTPLVTHTFGLEQAEDAFRTATRPESGAVKVHITAAG